MKNMYNNPNGREFYCVFISLQLRATVQDKSELIRGTPALPKLKP